MINPKIPRSLRALIEKKIGQQKVILIFGSRRTGKTYLMSEVFESFSGTKLMLNGEDLEVQRKLGKRIIEDYKSQFLGTALLCIDEAQHIQDVGLVLKMLIDHVPGITIIATGSSAFDLYGKSGEPLTGRSYTFSMYPISIKEISGSLHPFQLDRSLLEFLRFGSYPEIFQLQLDAEKESYLYDLVQSYLMKDILSYEGIKYASKVKELLLLIAYQMGQEVSLNELSRSLSIHKSTVERLLDLLHKNFVIFPITGYGSNLRKEVTKSKKWYFYDCGIRNALIRNFKSIDEREDRGALFENFFINERMKKSQRDQIHSEWFFWRTYDQREVDFLELRNGQVNAFECKWSTTKKYKAPKQFRDTYPDAVTSLVTPQNWLEYIL